MMMNRIVFASALALLGLPAFAQSSPTDEIVSALRSHGYRIVVQERTWLGRERVVAETATKRRELVFNPGTGEIMRDYVTALSQGDGDHQTQGAIGVASGDEGLIQNKAGPIDDKGPPTVGVTVDPDSLVGEPVVDPVTDVAQ
jgi:hypothetical protein